MTPTPKFFVEHIAEDKIIIFQRPREAADDDFNKAPLVEGLAGRLLTVTEAAELREQLRVAILETQRKVNAR